MESVPSRPSTRHHRCDPDFLELLHEDFGIQRFSLQSALIGAPSVPKKEAIAICAWAVRVTPNLDDAGDALRAWARKNNKGSYHPNIINAPLLHDDEEA